MKPLAVMAGVALSTLPSAILLDGKAADVRYDLVWLAPRTLQMDDGTHLIVVVDDEQFPKRIEELDAPDYGEESG